MSFSVETVPVASGLLGLGLMGFRLSSSGSGSVTDRSRLPKLAESSAGTTLMTPALLQVWTSLPQSWMPITTLTGCMQPLTWAFTPLTALPLGEATRVGSITPMVNSLRTMPGGFAYAGVLDRHERTCCGAAHALSICALPCACPETGVKSGYYFKPCLSNRRRLRRSTQVISMTPFVQALSVQLRLDPAVLYLATDGSEHLEVGSYAVAVHPGGFTCATGNGDEDQSSFKQELLGFDCAASALAVAVRETGWTGRVVFALDSQSALRVVLRQDYRFCFLLRLVERTRASLLELAAMQVQSTFVWVPSHGKRPQWQPPSGLCADRVRWLNDRADRAAADCRHRRSGGRGRAEWWRLREVAGAWELGATQALAAAGQLLHAELRRHGLRPREPPPPAAVAEAHGGFPPPAEGHPAPSPVHLCMLGLDL